MTIQAFYSLTGEPFHKSIKTKDLFESEATKEILSRLEYMSNHCGLMLITGEAGIGKTTSLRRFVDLMNPQRYQYFYIPLSTVNVMDFYRQLNKKLGGTNAHRKADLFRSIQTAVRDYAANKKIVPVIIFDEAHLLSRENLFELQIITNYNMDSIDPALIILAGQSHFLDRIKLSAHESLYQRIQLKYHIPPLQKKETAPYIEHHLKLMGCKEPIFTPGAIESIYQNTMGNMRMVGKLAVKTLTLGFYENKHTLTEEEVFNAGREL